MTFQEETKSRDSEDMPVIVGLYNDEEIFNGIKRQYEEVSPLSMRLTDGFTN